LISHTEHSDLQDLFKRFGAILSAWVKMENGRSKGYGFVSFDNPRSAANAIEEMHGFEIGGKRLKVELKKGEDNSSGQVAVSLKQTSFNPL
jgi:RNA recognition motif-containing protein